MQQIQTFPSAQDIHSIETHALSGLTLNASKKLDEAKRVYDPILHKYVPVDEITLPEVEYDYPSNAPASSVAFKSRQI